MIVTSDTLHFIMKINFEILPWILTMYYSTYKEYNT